MIPGSPSLQDRTCIPLHSPLESSQIEPMKGLLKMNLLWEGSSKNVSSVPEGIRLDFTDFVSVFDRGRIPCEFPGLGALRCGIATRLFEKMKGANFSTHFLKRVSSTSMLVKAFDVPEKMVSFARSNGRLLPLEILVRFTLGEKFIVRIKDGTIDLKKLNSVLEDGQTVVKGMVLKYPFIECSTKHRAADTYIDDAEAAQIAELSLEQLNSVYDLAHSIAVFLKNLFMQRGFTLADMKFEIAFTPNGECVVVDAVSPDEMRLIGSDGKSYDKDPIRKWYEEYQADWVKELLEAKKSFPDNKSKWPLYRAVPPRSVIEDVTARFHTIAKVIGANI